MDLKICAALAVLETAAAIPLREFHVVSALRTWIAFLLFQYLLVKAYRVLVYPFYVSPLRHLPGPKDNHFFIGQTANLFRGNSPNDAYVSWMRRWPDAPFIRYLSFANSEVLLVNNLTAHKEVLQTQCYKFVKPNFFERLVGEVVGKGLLFSVGDEHKRQRKLLAGPMSAGNIRRLHPVFQDKAKDLSTFFDAEIQADSSGTSGIVDVASVFPRVTLDVIGVTALGVELGNLSTSDASLSSHKFRELYHDIFVQQPLGQLITFINPFIPLRWLPLEANRRFIRANTEVWGMLRQVLRQRISDLAAVRRGDAKPREDGNRDLLTFMVEENMDNHGQWTENDMLEHIVQFFAAGHETTATALMFATYALATKPEIQDCLRAEVMSALGNREEIGPVDIEAMAFLNNFCREVLRVYSPTLTIPREAGSDLIVDGVAIPKGTALNTVPMVPHMNTHIWGPDAEEFDPDRWDNLKGDAASPYAFETLANGPRICIGKQFAILQMKTVLIEMVRNFVFEPVDLITAYENPAIVLKPKGGLKVRVRRI